jgi:hypothetical protein
MDVLFCVLVNGESRYFEQELIRPPDGHGAEHDIHAGFRCASNVCVRCPLNSFL